MKNKIFIDDLYNWKIAQQKSLDNISFTKYLNNIFNKNKNIRFYPTEASICITEKCNLQCQHCYENHKNINMSFDKLSNILYQLKRSQIIELTLTGGEPFLHPKIFDIISLAKNLKFILHIQTNATVLDNTKVKILKKLLNNRIDTIQVSLDGSKEAIHNKQRGTGFNETIKNIKILANNNLKVLVNISPSKNNEDDIYNTFKLADNLGAYGFGATPIAYIGKGTKNIEADRFKTLEQENLIINEKNRNIKYFGGVSGELLHLSCNKNFINKIKCLSKKTTSEYNLQNYICTGGKTKCHVNVNGDVFPCVFAQNKNLKMGNIFKKDFCKIWFEDYVNSEFFKTKRNLKNEKCRSCELIQKCKGGCPGIAYEKYNNINKADPRCLR